MLSRRMVSPGGHSAILPTRYSRYRRANQLQLSKEEEGETGPDAEVTKEDQDKINSFSRLHNREKVLEEELKSKQVRGALELLLHFEPSRSPDFWIFRSSVGRSSWLEDSIQS